MIDEAEHAANASVNLNLITSGHGLALHMQFLGEKACDSVLTRIQDYLDRPEVKRRGFTVIKSQYEMEGSKHPVVEVSIGLLLIALLDTHEKKKRKIERCLRMCVYIIIVLAPSFVGIVYRSFGGKF